MCAGKRCPPYANCVHSDSGNVCVCPDCSPKGDKVCGTDGTTYKHSCELQKHACKKNKRISIASQGGCAGMLGPVYMERGCPANRANWLEGLKHSPPLHATHLIGTVSGLRALSFERPLSTTNITADEGNFSPSYFRFLHGHGPVLCLRLIYCIDLFRLTFIVFCR